MKICSAAASHLKAETGRYISDLFNHFGDFCGIHFSSKIEKHPSNITTGEESVQQPDTQHP